MKKFCRYALIDITTGYLLAGGQKYKDFDNGAIRYIDCGYFRHYLRKVFECFRTLEVNGRECAIFYWSVNGKKEVYNYVTLAGLDLNINGRGDFILDDRYKEPCFRRILEKYGVTS